MNPHAQPQLRAAHWAKLATVHGATNAGDALPFMVGLVAAAHAADRPIEAVIGRPSVESGQVLWAFGDLAPSVLAGVTPLERSRLEAMLRALGGWASGSASLVSLPSATPEQPDHRVWLDDLIHAVNAPLVWHLRAVPVTDAELSHERAARAAEIARFDAGGPAEKRRAERARRLVDVMEEEAPLGLWRVVVTVGASTPALASGLLAALAATVPAGVELAPGGTGLVGNRAVAELIRPPRREVAGVRIPERADWDGVQEKPAAPRQELGIGRIVGADDRATSMPATLSLDALNRHVFVTGSTGSGKSETVRTILTELVGAGVPWLVIEPAKAEYHALAHRAKCPIVMIRPGDGRLLPAGLNPLLPTSVDVGGKRRTFPLQTHIDLVLALFEASFSAEEPFPQILAAALAASYRSLGWDLVDGSNRRSEASSHQYPTMGMLRSHALRAVDAAGYGAEVRSNVRGFVDVRLGSLEHGTPGRFCTTPYELDLQQLSRRNVVVQIEDVGNTRDQSFLIGTLLIRWIEMLRLLGPRSGLQHVLVIEEAHRLLRRSAQDGTAGHAVEMIANLLAEVRAYGQGLIVAEQIPSKIVPDVVKNSSVKVVHRLPSADDRDFVGATMNLSEQQSRAVVAFDPGVAAVHSHGMDRPILVRIDHVSVPPAAIKPTRPPVSVTLPACVAPSISGSSDPSLMHELSRVVEDPHLVVWVELVVVSYLLGKPQPSLQRARAAELAGSFERDILHAALARTVERAVIARWRDVEPYFAVDRLVAHVSEQMVAFLIGGDWPLDPTRARWQVGEFRWVDVLDALSQDDVDPSRPHPLSARWQRTRPDLELPSAPATVQRTHVVARHVEHQRNLEDLLRGEAGPLHDERFVRDPRAILRRIGALEPWLDGFVPAP